VDTISAELNIRDSNNRIIPVDDDLLNYARRLVRQTSQARFGVNLLIKIFNPCLPKSLSFALNEAYRTFISASQYLGDLVNIQGGYEELSILASFLGGG